MLDIFPVIYANRLIISGREKIMKRSLSLISLFLIVIVGLVWFNITAMQVEALNVGDDKANEKLEYQKNLEQLKKENPEQYEENLREITLAMQILLGQLGYGVEFNGVLDNRTTQAIREYEEKREIPVTGNPLSLETIDCFMKDSEFLEKKPIILPKFDFSEDHWEDGYFSAKGTWIMDNEKLTNPEQTSSITCYRDLGICIHTTAFISRDNSDFLDVDTIVYYIERWDKNEIVTKPKDFACTQLVIRINSLQSSVNLIRSIISNEELCKSLEMKNKHSTLKDGVDVYLRLTEDYQKKREKLMKVPPAAKEFLE